jgi:hypothetical protein
LLATLLAIGLTASASAFPTIWSPAQREQLRERDRLVADAARLDRRGQITEAIAAAERKLAIERTLFDRDHDALVQTLEWLAKRYIARDDLSAARIALAEVRDIFSRWPNAKPWDVADARVNLANIEQLARFTAPERAELRRAESRLRTAERLAEIGRYHDAIAAADEGLDASAAQMASPPTPFTGPHLP